MVPRNTFPRVSNRRSPRLIQSMELEINMAVDTTLAPPAPNESRTERGPSVQSGFRTKNSLPADTRREVCTLLNQRLADCIDLETQCKQAHWNVKGPTFVALHKLFDEVNEAVEEYVDLLAERVVQLGGIAEGTAGVVAERSTLVDYPLALSSG